MRERSFQFLAEFMGFDELFEMDIEDSSVLAGDYSSGDHWSPAGPHLAGDIESRASGRLGGAEKGLFKLPAGFPDKASLPKDPTPHFSHLWQKKAVSMIHPASAVRSNRHLPGRPDTDFPIHPETWNE